MKQLRQLSRDRRERWCNPAVLGRPLIAVTTSELREAQTVSPTRHGEPRQHEMALGLKYLRAIEQAGGLPVVVPPLADEAVPHLLDRVDGLCLSGGPDLSPEVYGQRRHAETGPSERGLDDFELALTRDADARRLPILAICRGMQLLNVVRGGTLHQHLPDEVGPDVVHRQAEEGGRVTHWVRLEPASQVSKILQRSRTKVNSFHHQAIDRLGANLAITARASDGTVEGVEATDRRNVVAVQWHAECLVDRPEHAALFAWLVSAASDHRQSSNALTEAA